MHHRITVALALLTALGLGSTRLVAAAPPPTEPLPGEVLVITDPRHTNIQRAPIAVTAFIDGKIKIGGEVVRRIDSGLLWPERATRPPTSNNDVELFQNIPFAAPPVGTLRWKPPQSVAPWIGVRERQDYGPACPQVVNANGVPNGGGYIGPTSEDCLNLNVFAPANAHKAPVMVFDSGGGTCWPGPIPSRRITDPPSPATAWFWSRLTNGSGLWDSSPTPP